MNTNPRQDSKNAGSRDTPISPTVRVGPLMGLPALVKDHGVDPGQVFKSVGFELSEFAEPDYKIPFNQASRLLARCVESTGCETLGLKLGRTVEPSSLGVAGFMAKSASDVGSALHDFVNHLILHVYIHQPE